MKLLSAVAAVLYATAAQARHKPLKLDPATLPAHPRLITTDERLSEIAVLVASDAGAAALYDIVVSHGKALIAQPENGDGGAWDAAYTLSFLHRYECARVARPTPGQL